MGFEDFGLDLGNPDFVKYAESYGAVGERVNSAEELTSTLKGCMEGSGVHVIEVPIDYSGNKRVLSEEIKDLSSKIT
jgi:acetolactate synthase-1/2/3 large subunit